MIKSQFFDEKQQQQKKCQENLCNYKVAFFTLN